MSSYTPFISRYTPRDDREEEPEPEENDDHYRIALFYCDSTQTTWFPEDNAGTLYDLLVANFDVFDYGYKKVKTDDVFHLLGMLTQYLREKPLGKNRYIIRVIQFEDGLPFTQWFLTSKKMQKQPIGVFEAELFDLPVDIFGARLLQWDSYNL